MQTAYKPGMLLFSKEIQAYPKYRILYFVEKDTLEDEHPSLHRFIIRRTDFNKYCLGCSYDLQVRSNRIVGALLTGEDELPPEYYHPLMERLCLQFMPLHEARSLRRRGEEFFDPENYYTFEETRELVEYESNWVDDFIAWLVYVALRGAAMVIPVGLYVLFLYNWLTSPTRGASVGEILAMPVYALCAAVLVVFVMMALQIGVDALAYRMNVTRWFLIKRAVLRRTGRRVSINPSKARLKKLAILGSVSLAFALLGFIVLAV